MFIARTYCDAERIEVLVRQHASYFYHIHCSADVSYGSWHAYEKKKLMCM